MPPDPYAVIVLSILGSSIAVGLGSWLILLTGCLKRKHSQKRHSHKVGTGNTNDISGEAADINSSGGVAISGGTAGSGIATTPAKPVKSITPIAATPDKPGTSGNSKTGKRKSQKEDVEGESHDVSGNQARDSENHKDKAKSKEPMKKSNQKILDEREDKIAKGLVVRRQSDYPAMDDILSDWDDTDSGGGKKSRKSKKEVLDGGGGGGNGTSREKKKGKRRKNGTTKTITMTVDQTQLTRTRDK